MSFPFFYCFVSILDDISKRLGCVDNDITVWIAFRKGEEIVANLVMEVEFFEVEAVDFAVLVGRDPRQALFRLQIKKKREVRIGPFRCEEIN